MNAVNVFNIESTLNVWLGAQLDLAKYAPPSFFSGYPGDKVIFNMPEVLANVPAFSAHHLPIETQDRWQGRRVGEGERGVWYEAFMDVSAWVSRKNANWLAERRWMGAVLQDIVIATKSVQVTDYLTDYPASASADYAIYIDRIDSRQTMPDGNPDFERERFLIKYHIVLRSDD